jgi:hypothetical protein
MPGSKPGFSNSRSFKPNSHQADHNNVMPYLWTIAINFVIFFALYKYRKYSMFLHILGGFGISVATVVLSLPLLI